MKTRRSMHEDASPPAAGFAVRSPGKAIVSFVTRPGRGSEGGVGWAFLAAAARRAQVTGEALYAIIDERDQAEVAHSIAGVPGGERVRLVPIRIPSILLARYGERRTRMTYLGWRGRARRAVKELAMQGRIDLAHQVTFATATLPPALPRYGLRTVWGPIAVTTSPQTPHFHARARERAIAGMGRLLARINAWGINFVIATNGATAEFFALWGVDSPVEPNIFLSPRSEYLPSADTRSLVSVGRLGPGKRTWLAVEAMSDPRLTCFTLDIIGEGPELPSLRRLVHERRLNDRVRFLGQLSHEETIKRFPLYRVLIHPSSSEGASWVVGEAAAAGVPAVVFSSCGASSTVRLSDNGGVVIDDSAVKDASAALADGIVKACSLPRPEPSDRWQESRLDDLLARWWTPGAA